MLPVTLVVQSMLVHVNALIPSLIDANRLFSRAGHGPPARPASVIFMRTISTVRPPATIRSGVAIARPAMHRSTNSGTVKPCASMTGSVQPSGAPASNLSVRRRSDVRSWRRAGWGMERTGWMADHAAVPSAAIEGVATPQKPGAGALNRAGLVYPAGYFAHLLHTATVKPGFTAFFTRLCR